ncbi:ESPR-type extended signal peptide-containing protein, partial [Acinetobacter junii]|uniref:ESPR-type extended signal peptide-containing protein n=3 Tax=Acinetobacter junii TaxID=40215 RepID=UPI002351013E
MNKVYKVVWNASIGIWVAVSEIAKGNTKSKSKTVTVGSVVVAIIGAVTFSPNAMGETGISGGTGSGTAISSSTGTSGGGSGATYCGTGSTQAFTGTGTRTIAIGCDARAEGTNSVIADRSNPYNTTAINPRVNYGTSSAANLAIGTGAFSGGNYTDVNGTTQTVSQATAIGSWATAQHVAAIAIGSASLATGNTSLAVGRQSVASGDYAQALGNVSAATGTGSLAIGHSATATGYRGIAIGAPDIATAAVVAGQQGAAYQTVGYTLASGKDSIAFGGGAQATQENALSIGAFSKATGTKSVAIGTGAEATAASALVIGENAKTAVAGGVALGMDAQVVGENSVAVGKGSIAVAQSGNSFLTNVAPSATNGVVSVGTTGTTRRIQNVADGAADQDAVTVAQLTRVNDRAVGNTTALGGGAAYDPQTKAYTAPTFTTTKTDGTTVSSNTVSGALTNLNNEVVKPITFNGNTGTSTNKLGSTLNITGGLTGASSNANVKTIITGNTVDIQIADAPNFAGTVTSTGQQVNGNSVITGTSTIGSGANAVTLSGTANGLDVGNKKISNVAAPSAGSDATNKTYVDGKVQALGDTPLGFIGDSGTKATRKLGEDLNVKGGATGTLTNGNIGVVSNGTNQLDIKLAETVNLGANGSVTTGSTVVSNIGVTTPQVVIGTGANTTTLTSNGTSLNVGGDKITNVAAGTASGDAVNFGQLTTTNNNVTTAQNAANAAQTTADSALTEAQKGLNFRANAGATDKVSLGETVTLADGTNTTVTYDAATNTYKYSVVDAPTFTGTVTAGNLATGGTLSVTGVSNLNGGANLNNQKITNVAAGTASGDAVNFGQLTTTNNNVTTAQNAANAAQTSANAAQTTANSALTEAQKGLNFRANAGATDKVSLGETITLADGTNATVTYDAATNTYKYSVVDAPTFAGTVTAGNLATGGTLSVTGVSNLNGGANLNNQKITNLGDGSVASGSKDAVNGSQLFTTNQKVDQNTTNIAKNTGDIATNTSDITTLKGGFNLQTNGTNVGAIKAGDTVDIGVVDPLDTNLTATKTNNNVAFALSKNLNLTSVTTGNTVINNAGVTADKVTVGNVVIDKTTNQISGVEAGTNTKDAVNKGQLDALAAQQAASDNAAVKYDDAAVKDKVTLAGAGGTTLTNVKAGDVSATSTDAVNGSQLFTTNQKVDQNTTNIATNTANIATNTSDITTLKGGFNLQTNGTNVGAIKAGDTVDIGVVDPLDTNLTATKTNNNVAFALSKNLNLTSVTTGNTVINNAGVTADKVTVGNVVIDKTTNQISGVEAGTNTKDAVNKGQLDALAAQQAASDNAAVKYDDAAVKDKVTLAGASGTTLTNVKAGDVSATSTDAVNGSQLFTTNQKVDQNTTNIATNTANIATNTNNIATNTSDITTLKGGFNLQTNGTNVGAIKAGDTVDIGVVDPLDTNLTATKTNNNVAFALSKNLNLTSVTTGNTVINNAGVTADKVTVGNVVIDKTTNQISGVEAGTNTKDAVNKGQLDALAAQQAASDNAAVKYDDAAVKDKVTLAGASGTTLTNVKAGDVSATSTDAVNGSQLFTTNQKVDQNTTNIAKNTGDIATNTSDITTLKGGFNLQTNGTNVGAIKAGDTVDIGVVDPLDTNLTATKTNNNVAFALSKNLNLTSVTTGNTVINNAGVTADKVTVGNVVIDKTTNQISGVEAGTNTKDAVNKGQLDALAAQQAASDNAAVKYDDAAVKDKVTLAGASGTTLTNVKAGDVSATSTDAVNGSQLFTTNQKVDQNTTNIAKNTGDIATNTANIATNTSDITTLKGGFNLQTNGTNVGAIKAGDTVDIGVVDP